MSEDNRNYWQKNEDLIVSISDGLTPRRAEERSEAMCDCDESRYRFESEQYLITQIKQAIEQLEGWYPDEAVGKALHILKPAVGWQDYPPK